MADYTNLLLVELALRSAEAEFELAPVTIPCALRSLEALRPSLDQRGRESLDHCLFTVKRGLSDRHAITHGIVAVKHIAMYAAQHRQAEEAVKMRKARDHGERSGQSRREATAERDLAMVEHARALLKTRTPTTNVIGKLIESGKYRNPKTEKSLTRPAIDAVLKRYGIELKKK